MLWKSAPAGQHLHGIERAEPTLLKDRALVKCMLVNYSFQNVERRGNGNFRVAKKTTSTEMFGHFVVLKVNAMQIFVVHVGIALVCIESLERKMCSIIVGNIR